MYSSNDTINHDKFSGSCSLIMSFSAAKSDVSWKFLEIDALRDIIFNRMNDIALL